MSQKLCSLYRGDILARNFAHHHNITYVRIGNLNSGVAQACSDSDSHRVVRECEGLKLSAEGWLKQGSYTACEYFV